MNWGSPMDLGLVIPDIEGMQMMSQHDNRIQNAKWVNISWLRLVLLCWDITCIPSACWGRRTVIFGPSGSEVSTAAIYLIVFRYFWLWRSVWTDQELAPFSLLHFLKNCSNMAQRLMFGNFISWHLKTKALFWTKRGNVCEYILKRVIRKHVAWFVFRKCTEFGLVC